MIRRSGVVCRYLVIVCCLSGCTTLVSVLEPNSPKIYGGTRMNLEAQVEARTGATPDYGWTWFPLVFVDLPLSAAADTVLLPLTIAMESF